MAQNANTYSVKFGDENAHSGNIPPSFNRTYEPEDVQIMNWLSPLEPNNRHQGVRQERFDGIGDWLLDTGEFREWRGGEGGAENAVLFCSGNPGVGKTYLNSLVIDTLRDHSRKENIAVTGFYYDFLAQQEHTITNVMGAILKQLVGRGRGGSPNGLREAFQQAKDEFGGSGLRLADLMRMLRSATASLPSVFICIDALDECLPKYLPELLESLRDIVRESPTTRIFLTGRPHVGENVRRYFTKVVVIPISPNTGDIRNYVEMRLDRDTEPEAMNNDLRADIVRAILEKISDIFLLVSLSIDAILGEVTIRQRRKKLDEMTQGNGLGDAYTATLTRLKAQKGLKSVLGLKVLMWVLYSERPLQAQELRHALGVEIGSADLDPENVPALRTLVASCLGLVTVEAPSSTIRLVSPTLQKHLTSDPTLFHSPHSTIAEVCLTYLNFGSVRDLSPTPRSAPSTFPLLEYASRYWANHASRGMTKNVQILALRLLNKFDGHTPAQLMSPHHSNDRGSGPYLDRVGKPIGFSGLHGAVSPSAVGRIAAVLEMIELGVNATDSTGSTALTWAARGGEEEAVKAILELKDVNPDPVDSSGRTPLSWAAGNGHEGIIKIFLEREDVNPDAADSSGRSPLSWAASNGHEGAAKMVLEREDVIPDHSDSSGRTPLSWAAGNGHEGVVLIFFEREDVNPDVADSSGRTPLSWAAGKGHEGVVKMLVEREDAMPDLADSSGRTPLSWATGSGREGAVKMFLEREDVTSDLADSSGRTPLSWATGGGHVEVVKMILEREDVIPDLADSSGRTPLSWATGGGHVGVVKIILEREDITPDLADSSGRTPLSWATGSGHEGVAKTFLVREDAIPDLADSSGRTPLSWAAGNGHEGVVKMFVEREDVIPDLADSSGRTPLSWAAGNGHERVVKMFLERKDVIPDLADSGGRTPLLWATSRRDERVVKLFLERRYLVPSQAPIDQVPPASLRVVIDVCFLIAALFFLSHLLTIA